MNANTHALSGLHVFARSSRAQFSPVTRRVAPRYVARPGSDHRMSAAVAARDFAERSFLRRWMQPGFLDRAQPALTHFRD